MTKSNKAQKIDTTKLVLLGAVPDAPPEGHVSLRPKNPGLMGEWAATRGTDTIHRFTEEIKVAIVEAVRRPK